MKKLVLLLILSSLLIGCEKAPSKPLIVINNYSVSAEEFDRDFKNSVLGKNDTLETRKQYLEMLISRKLMLQEAQRLGLDKEQEFLDSITRFWEQSLLKVFIERRSHDVAGRVVVSDFAVQQAYKNLAAEGKADKPYEEMYRTLKWDLARAKEQQMMDDLLKDLRRKAVIKENLELLKVNK